MSQAPTDSLDGAPTLGAVDTPSLQRSSSRKRNTPVKDEEYDSDDYTPVPKRAKSATKSETSSAAKRATTSSSQAKSKRSTSATSSSTTLSPQMTRKEIPAVGEALAMPRASSASDLLAQYQGIPLDELRMILPPQEYIKVSIMRSMAESEHGGKEKNVPKFLHPDLTASALPTNLNWELELRSMVGTWVELPIVSTSALAVLEAESIRYTASLVQELIAAVSEHMKTGFVNERPQKPIMFSNQAQRIDLKAVTAPPAPQSSTDSPSTPATSPSKPDSKASLQTDGKLEAELDAVDDEDDDEEDEEDELFLTKRKLSQNASNNEEEVAQEANKEEEEEATTGASVRGTTKAGYDRIPIGTLDHLAEALVRRHPSLVRRLEYIMKRLAEDVEAQHVNKDTQTEGVRADSLQEDDYDPIFSLQDIWTASPELETYLLDEAPKETREREEELRGELMAERMVRVDKIPTERLDDWQNASSTSFARPRRLHKFKSWLVQYCGWNQHELCIPATLATAINFLMYEHLRYIVRAALGVENQAERGPKWLAMQSERLRAEIEARVAAGDSVQTRPLAPSDTSSSLAS